MALISCIKQATEVCVLQTRSQGRNYNVPGWSDLVKENHDVARSAFLDWVSVGRPRTGHFHKHMCHSRAHLNWHYVNVERMRNWRQRTQPSWSDRDATAYRQNSRIIEHYRRPTPYMNAPMFQRNVRSVIQKQAFSSMNQRIDRTVVE